MFEKHRQEKAAQEQEAARAAWQGEDSVLKGLRALVANGGGADGGGPAEVPIVLKRNERSVYLFGGGGLFEPVRGPGHYAGASSGVSVPIGSTGARYRIGKSRGTFVQGQENPAVIDRGTVVITDQRVVFMGTKRTMEWAFSKLIGIQHYQNRPWTAIQVSNRQKVTGVTYDAVHERNFRLRLEAAVALFTKDPTELLGQLDEAIQAHDRARPELALAAEIGAEPGSAPAGDRPPPPRPNWYPDPERRHQYRYWDGARWTDEVADAGIPGVDGLRSR